MVPTASHAMPPSPIRPAAFSRPPFYVNKYKLQSTLLSLAPTQRPPTITHGHDTEAEAAVIKLNHHSQFEKKARRHM